MDEFEVLDLHRRTAFTFDERGRVSCESAPDRSRGPRFRIEGCRDGNIALIREDVPDDQAAELERLADDEPPLFAADATPGNLTRYLAVLDDGVSEPSPSLGLQWVFPETGLRPVDGFDLVRSGTPNGDRLLDRFVDATHESLKQAGFREPGDLWEPWCLAVVDSQIVSIAETVRTGPRGAEVGVDTATAFRGQGLGAATTAGWSTHPALEQRTLFYGTSRSNSSSRRLVARLELRFLGSTLSID